MITPLALLGLLILPIIVAFYMLRLRRRDVLVGSTFLWQQLVRDVEANAPWQRLRFSWLLLLQLLIALLIVLAAARPFSDVESRLAGNVVLIVDTSASMGAVEPDGSRIELARRAARGIVDELPQGGRITVVAASDTARVLVSESDDLAAALDAIDGIEASQLPGDLTDAFALASALADREAESSVVIVTDASIGRLPPVGIGSPVHVERVGSTDANQAIAALSVARRAGGAQLDVFVAVANPSAADATRRLELYADGALIDVREMQIPAGERVEAIVSSLPAGAQVVEARLAGSDALAVDDVAFALVPSQAPTRALLVGDGNTYLESALALLPRLELYAVGPDGYRDALQTADEAGTPYEMLIFDRHLPGELPSVPTLFVGPPAAGPFGTVGRVIEAPRIARPDPSEPLLRHVDLSTLHIGRVRSLTLGEEMRAVVETGAGDPLLAVGRVDGRPIAVLAFALGESDLPLQVAFPLLVSNLVDYLLPAVDGVLPPSAALGEPVALALDPALEVLTVIDGENERPLSLAGGRGTLPAASQVGIRELRNDAGDLLGRIAANLFSPDESRVTPGDPMRLVDMGRVGGSDGSSVQQSRAEWWWPLVLIGLVLLCAEWIFFHRPTRRSTTRAMRRLRGWRPAFHRAGGVGR